jgi:2-polyprenyl-6-methoxyphenol hydroxylase-like FAD-dependent oxidoreductase
VLGYILARAGIEVTVLEKWPDFFRDFRGDTIHSSTMAILRELGLIDEFLKLPHSEMETMTLHIGGEPVTIADFRKIDAREKFIAFVPQWDFLNFLSEKAKQFPTFHLLMETEATDVVREAGRVVGVRAKKGSEEYEIRAQLVVGADGRHSTVREKAGFEIENKGVPIDVLWFRVGLKGKDEKRSLAYADDGRALVMLDRHDFWQCAYIIKKDTFKDWQVKGLAAFKESIAQIAPTDSISLDEIDSWDKVKLLSVTVDHAKEWAQDGIVLIGDAAHAMSPLGGVGINYAIHDAVAAANILVPALRAGDTSLATLHKIQARRGGPVKKMQTIQVRMQDHVLSPLLNTHGHMHVPFILKLFRWFPALQKYPARMIGYGFQPEHIEVEF